MIASLSPNGQNQIAGSSAATRLLVATLKGINILERENPSAPWVDRGRKMDGHHCSSITIEPRRGGIFAGMHSGGLYFSQDGGETWSLRNNGLIIEHVYCVGYAYRGENISLYAGTEPASMFRSDDYGLTWIEQPGVKETKGRDKWSFPSPPFQAHTKTMTIDQREPDVIYAGVEQGDLLKTVDGGVNWFPIDDFSKPTDWTYRDIHLVAVHPDNTAELYMTTGMGLYRSYDAGLTWKLIVDNSFAIGYPDHLIISPLDGNTMFMAGAAENPGTWQETHNANASIAVSHDRGLTWKDASKGLPDDRRPNIEAMSIASYPGGFTLFAGDTDGMVFASEDGAQTWQAIGAKLAPVTKGRHYRSLQLAS